MKGKAAMRYRKTSRRSTTAPSHGYPCDTEPAPFSVNLPCMVLCDPMIRLNRFNAGTFMNGGSNLESGYDILYSRMRFLTKVNFPDAMPPLILHKIQTFTPHVQFHVHP